MAMGVGELALKASGLDRAKARRDERWLPARDGPSARLAPPADQRAASAAVDPPAGGGSDMRLHAGTGRKQGQPALSGVHAAAHSDRTRNRSRKALDPDAIISRSWARSLWTFSGRDGIVEYVINHEGQGSGNLPMSRDEQGFVRKTFALVDRLTGLSFEETSAVSKADIRVHCARKLGGSEGVASLNNGWFDVYWKDKKGWSLTKFEKHVIRHEIGHTLGLDHPYGRGGHPRYDTHDTVMSYNWRGNTNFTNTDIQAMQELWGA
jgi:hypothetical protein